MIIRMQAVKQALYQVVKKFQITEISKCNIYSNLVEIIEIKPW